MPGARLSRAGGLTGRDAAAIPRVLDETLL
jgi:hypothetical protein